MADQPVQDERGASAVEYALLLSGIAAILVTAVFLFGGGVTGLFGNSCNSINQEISASNC